MVTLGGVMDDTYYSKLWTRRNPPAREHSLDLPMRSIKLSLGKKHSHAHTLEGDLKHIPTSNYFSAPLPSSPNSNLLGGMVLFLPPSPWNILA